MAVQELSQPAIAWHGGVDVTQPRRMKPVKWWAALGACFLVVEAYIFGSWILSDNFTRTPSGPTPVPGWMQGVMDVHVIIGVPAFALFLWFFLVRPWRREGRITTDGLLTLVFLSLYWQDCFVGYFAPWVTYNAKMFNMGSWLPNMGSNWPNANRFAEPFIWAFPLYSYLVLGVPILGCFVMRKAKARWPHLGTFGLVMVGWSFFIVFDMVMEPGWLRLGLFSYGGSIGALTLWHGHYYQYPLYEAPVWGACWAAWACLRYFKNDKGQTLAERGIDEIRATPKQKTGLRLLALVGICNLIFLAFYNIPIQIFGIWADTWPQDVQSRSYFTNGLCGPGTDVACPGPDVPMPRRGSTRLGPDGQLVVPAGARVPSVPAGTEDWPRYEKW